MQQKPCVVVESQWEDNTYRIESKNIILFIADILVSPYLFVVSYKGEGILYLGT